jgi:hypothetical protein
MPCVTQTPCTIDITWFSIYKYSQAQQTHFGSSSGHKAGTCNMYNIKYEKSTLKRNNLQLYICHRILIFLRQVSTHFPSHPQALLNLRLITFIYLRKCVRDLIGLQPYSICLNKTDKSYFRKS